MSKTSETKSRPRVGFWRWVWRISAGTFAVLVVLLALFIGLFRVAVPLLPDYQQRIESAATRALGYPLSVGAVDARWRLHGPELVFNDVIVRTSDNERSLFEAERLRVAIDLMTLIKSGSIQPSSLTLTGSLIEILRDAKGNWYVQGLEVDSLRTDQPASSAWGVADGLFGVRNLSVNFTDQLLGKSLIIPDIDLDVSVEETLLGVSGELEFERRGPRVEFSLDANGQARFPEQVEWTGYLAGSDINWTSINGLLPDHIEWSTRRPFDLSVWLRANGKQPLEARVTIDVEDLQLEDENQSVGRIAGQFSWTGQDGGWQLSGKKVDVSSSRASPPRDV